MAILLVLAIGVPASGQVEPRLVSRNLTVPAGSFIPSTSDRQYANTGRRLATMSGAANFSAPLAFPRPTVHVNKLTIYVYDKDYTDRICVGLHATRPKARGHRRTRSPRSAPTAPATTTPGC